MLLIWLYSCWGCTGVGMGASGLWRQRRTLVLTQARGHLSSQESAPPLTCCHPLLLSSVGLFVRAPCAASPSTEHLAPDAAGTCPQAEALRPQSQSGNQSVHHWALLLITVPCGNRVQCAGSAPGLGDTKWNTGDCVSKSLYSGWGDG